MIISTWCKIDKLWLIFIHNYLQNKCSSDSAQSRKYGALSGNRSSEITLLTITPRRSFDIYMNWYNEDCLNFFMGIVEIGLRRRVAGKEAGNNLLIFLFAFYGFCCLFKARNPISNSITSPAYTSLQRPVFPSNHPTLLNFDILTRTGVSTRYVRRLNESKKKWLLSVRRPNSCFLSRMNVR